MRGRAKDRMASKLCGPEHRARCCWAVEKGDGWRVRAEAREQGKHRHRDRDVIGEFELGQRRHGDTEKKPGLRWARRR